MENLDDELQTLSKFMTENTNINTVENDFPDANTIESNHLPFFQNDQIPAFYKDHTFGKLRWNLKGADEYDLRLTGSINMLPPEKIMGNWKGVVYFDTDDSDQMKYFRPIDLFSDDACAGVYEKDASHLMHLFLYEGQPISLNLSIDNYLLMAMELRGFYFWQYLILYFLDGNENEVVTDYKNFSANMKHMYSLDEIKLKYNQLRST